LQRFAFFLAIIGSILVISLGIYISLNVLQYKTKNKRRFFCKGICFLPYSKKAESLGLRAEGEGLLETGKVTRKITQSLPFTRGFFVPALAVAPNKNGGTASAGTKNCVRWLHKLSKTY